MSTQLQKLVSLLKTGRKERGTPAPINVHSGSLSGSGPEVLGNWQTAECGVYTSTQKTPEEVCPPIYSHSFPLPCRQQPHKSWHRECGMQNETCNFSPVFCRGPAPIRD